MGRLASYAAKQVLNGQRVVVVRCEEIIQGGSIFRNRLVFMEYLRKRMNSNPTRGFKHYRSPSRMLFKSIRGMLPRKTARGEHAMGRLKLFEGVPPPFDKKLTQVIPDALRSVRMKPYRKYCVLGELAAQVGWKQQAVVKRLETKRLDRSKQWHQTQLKKKELAQKASNSAACKDVNKMLAALGY